MAHSAASDKQAQKKLEKLLASRKGQHGIEGDLGFLKDPLFVNHLFSKGPERMESLGFALPGSSLAPQPDGACHALLIETDPLQDPRDGTTSLRKGPNPT